MDTNDVTKSIRDCRPAKIFGAMIIASRWPSSNYVSLSLVRGQGTKTSEWQHAIVHIKMTSTLRVYFERVYTARTLTRTISHHHSHASNAMDTLSPSTEQGALKCRTLPSEIRMKETVSINFRTMSLQCKIHENPEKRF